jgi:hypothetical protein
MAIETTNPARQAEVDPPEPSEPAGPTEEALTQGRSPGTPFVLLGGVALVIWSVVAIVAGGLLLLWWLT